MRQLWNHTQKCLDTYQKYLATKWTEVMAQDWDEDNKKLIKDMRDVKVDRKCNAFIGINNELKIWSIFLPLVSQLQEDCMEERHWDLMRKTVKQKFVIDENFLL